MPRAFVEGRAGGRAGRRPRGARLQPPTRTLTGWIGPPAEDRDELVAGLLHPQGLLDERPVVGRHRDARSRSRGSRARGAGRCGARGSRSTRRSRAGAAGRGRRVDPDAEEVLERVDRAHLVGDRADPADAGDDVDDLVGRPADDELLEVARRLEDPEAGLDRPRRPGRGGGASPRPRRGSARRPRRGRSSAGLLRAAVLMPCLPSSRPARSRVAARARSACRRAR